METEFRGISYSKLFWLNKLRRDKSEAMTGMILKLQREVEEE